MLKFIAKIKQYFCQHELEPVVYFGIDTDIFREKGIKREVPIFSCHECKKCSYQQDIHNQITKWRFLA